MSPRTPTAPLTDRRMWRRAFRMAHPDAPAGHAEVFVWLQSVREHLDECPGSASREVVEPPAWASRRRGSASRTRRPERIPYDPQLGYKDEFWQLTHRALSVGRSVEEPYRSALALLIDCGATDHGHRAERQCRGATYKQLAAIGHAVGMGKEERGRWYEICRSIPLSDAHASHLLTKLKRREQHERFDDTANNPRERMASVKTTGTLKGEEHGETNGSRIRTTGSRPVRA